MRISTKHKIVVLSNPKCASTTFCKMFDQYSDFTWETKSKCKGLLGVDYNGLVHQPAKNIKKIMSKKGLNWNTFHSLITIRNPWDRVVSLFHYNKEKSEYTKSFEYFVKNDLKKSMGYTTFDMIHQNGECIVTSIIKIEEMEIELSNLLRDMKFDFSIHENVCKSREKDYRKYYTLETQEIVRNLYWYDIHLGVYQF
jgi:hypothetical protein